MKVFVTAKPRAKKEGVEKINETHFVVAVKEPPKEGRANEAVIRALAEYLDITPSKIRIVSGHKSKRKILEYQEKHGQNHSKRK